METATRRRIIRAWRSLTTARGERRIGPGKRTLVACSGGADSSALVFALAKQDIVVGHVVHDLRPRADALADRDAVRGLAERLGLKFVEVEVEVRGKGNAEGVARKLRYAALMRMARETGCGFVATGHHAEDQLETMVMAMMRGAGARGMSGVAVKRRDEGGAWIVRPLLGDEVGRVPPTSRAEAEAMCVEAGWEWRRDATNEDAGLLRNALRRDVLPVLEQLRPGAAKRAARSAAMVRGAAVFVGRRAGELWDGRVESDGIVTWPRAALRREPAVVVGELIRRACGREDAMSRRSIAPVLAAIGDRGTDPREFVVGRATIRVTARAVVIGLRSAP